MSATKQGDIVGFLEVANNGVEVTDKSTEALMILCPICGDDYNHFERVQKLNGWDSAGGPAKTELKTRSDGIRSKFTCENGGHVWSIVIAHHKGHEYLATENLTNITDDNNPADRYDRCNDNPADRYNDPFSPI